MCVCDFLFGPDAYAAARAFYGPWAFNSLLAEQQERQGDKEAWKRIAEWAEKQRQLQWKAQLTREAFIDDVAWQIKNRSDQ